MSEIYILELKYPYNLGTAGTEIPLSLELPLLVSLTRHKHPVSFDRWWVLLRGG